MENTTVTHSVPNPKEIAVPEWYAEAVAVISTSKTWKKWSRPVSKKFYEQLLGDIRNSFSAMGLDCKALGFFITDTIDYYIDHGTLKPTYSQYIWELGLFHAFKRRIDEAIVRRCRAIARAAARRARIETESETETEKTPVTPPAPSTSATAPAATTPSAPATASAATPTASPHSPTSAPDGS